MGWGLSSWYGLVRCLQILASLAASVLQAVLLAYTTINRLGPGQSLPVLQGMMTASLLFSVLALALIRTGNRWQKTQWLVAVMGGDLVFIGILLAELTILSSAGLPANCSGLTRSNYLDGDSKEQPKQGYSSIRFTNMSNGNKGELDRFCALSRGFYTIAIALVFTFIGSIIVEVLMVVAGNYTKNSHVQQQIENAIRDAEKEHSEPSSVASVGGHPQHQQQRHPPIAVATDAPIGPTHPHHHHNHHHHHHLPSPHHTVHRHDSGSAHTIPSPVSPVTPHSQHHQHHYHPPAMPSAYADQMASSSSAAPRSPIGNNTFGYDATEEDAAAAALITDGLRSEPEPGRSGLPPRYTPGTLYPMSGHADETNEMRLSDYVKGETRAQNMKDGFR